MSHSWNTLTPLTLESRDSLASRYASPCPSHQPQTITVPTFANNHPKRHCYPIVVVKRRNPSTISRNPIEYPVSPLAYTLQDKIIESVTPKMSGVGHMYLICHSGHLTFDANAYLSRISTGGEISGFDWTKIAKRGTQVDCQRCCVYTIGNSTSSQSK